MRRLVVAALLFGLASAAWATDPGRLALARSKTDKGEKQLAKENYEKAESLFRAAIKDEPSFPDAHLGLAAALCGQQRYADALPVVRDAQDAYVTWHQDARVAEMEARQDAAARAREFRDLQQQQAQKSRPGQQQQGGVPAQDLARMAAARVASEEYISRRGWKMEEFDAIPAHAFYIAGLCRLRTGDRAGAITEFEACVTRNPDHGLAHYNLAVALFAEGDAGGAAEHLEAARNAGIEPHPKFVADLERRLEEEGAKPPGRE